MEFGLKGRHVAILAADGVDGAQLDGSRKALGDAGVIADVLAARGGELRGADGNPVSVDRTLEVCHAAEYDALVIPGGKQAAEVLGRDQRAIQFVKEFMAADKPVAAIGDGVRLLIAADTLAGRAIAATPAAAADVRQAGGELVDAAMHIDEKLITSRGGDLGALNAAIVREFANRVDEARVDQLSEQSFPASDPPPGPSAVGGQGASSAQHFDPRGADKDRGASDAGARR
jgi:deglycase